MAHELFWFAAGALLMLLEIVVPGGIVIFLGLGAMLAGASVALGLVDSVGHALILWCIGSMVLLFGLRTFFLRYFEGDSSVQDVAEESDYLSSLVEVVEEITPYREGRVLFRGVSWKARSEEALAVGATAVIRGRDGNTWIVSAL